jgi:regulator of sirC expression with transglutaminase-like and TPR domain
LTFISLRKGESEEAIKSCDAIVQINERYSYARVIRGEARTRLNDLDGAIIDQDRAIELTPDNAAACILRQPRQELRWVRPFPSARGRNRRRDKPFSKSEEGGRRIWTPRQCH